MGIKRYSLIIGLIMFSTPSASAACTEKTCVDVFTDQNQLVITAQKGAAKPMTKPAPKPTPKSTPKPATVVTKPVVTKSTPAVS